MGQPGGRGDRGAGTVASCEEAERLVGRVLVNTVDEARANKEDTPAYSRRRRATCRRRRRRSSGVGRGRGGGGGGLDPEDEEDEEQDEAAAMAAAGAEAEARLPWIKPGAGGQLLEDLRIKCAQANRDVGATEAHAMMMDVLRKAAKEGDPQAEAILNLAGAGNMSAADLTRTMGQSRTARRGDFGPVVPQRLRAGGSVMSDRDAEAIERSSCRIDLVVDGQRLSQMSDCALHAEAVAISALMVVVGMEWVDAFHASLRLGAPHPAVAGLARFELTDPNWLHAEGKPVREGTLSVENATALLQGLSFSRTTPLVVMPTAFKLVKELVMRLSNRDLPPFRLRVAESKEVKKPEVRVEVRHEGVSDPGMHKEANAATAETEPAGGERQLALMLNVPLSVRGALGTRPDQPRPVEALTRDPRRCRAISTATLRPAACSARARRWWSVPWARAGCWARTAPR